MCNWSCLSLLFIYSSASVFVIVAGQPTTDDDGDDNQLMNAVAKLQAEVAELKADRSTKRSDACNCKSAVLWNVIVCRVYAHYRRSLHCALASGAVYCNRSCLWVYLFVAGGRCLLPR